MIIDKGIQIKNIYIMLSYAFQELRQKNYENIQKQDFENVLDLLAEILYRGVSKQLKQGLHREYIRKNESLPTIRGKINLNETIRNIINRKRQIGCEFDVLSENNFFNRIIKSTILSLINEKSLKRYRKQMLRKVMPYFGNIDVIDLNAVQWKNLIYKKDNISYEMLMNICYFIYSNLLLTTEKGTYSMVTFGDKYMPALFEHFVLEYYKRHYPHLRAHADQIAWNITDAEEGAINLMPNMNSDITLHKEGDRVLIIDTKYYSKALIQHMTKNEIRSSHLYQIYTYVKNRDVESTGRVSGVLLYAKTDEEISPNIDIQLGGNNFSVRTLDLNCDFDEIAKQLDALGNIF